jgi:DNA (cytosine-5)-methyltransferase 1
VNYYNENDTKAAAWLSELIRLGHIPNGFVDTRSIEHVNADDLQQFTQCHFFAGIGGWSEALKIASVASDFPVWTGSCPCQPFSVAGQHRGVHDERHLWPVWLQLISKCVPSIIFGEQVASPDGRTWLSGIRADLEALGYAVGCADLCAAGIGAPHIRQRLYWVAHSSRSRWKGRQFAGGPTQAIQIIRRSPNGHWSNYGTATCTNGVQRRFESGTCPLVDGVPGRVGLLRGYGNAIVPQLAAEFIAASL